ncbi:1-aminocyclopropane-1-carboxylate oxidase 1 [Vigna radiata var. radiata]|uniref:1-aminocyclopropane-1-carboxylate oxidase 1 n=1 Tax=Vigna radiata var. radiata TaxID=3916 RepID=A0A1S3U402_VIGRR|nr:1-aminocyclopropane-1-carboxylate oxidase 1 [Vigna radiata var. radiata]
MDFRAPPPSPVAAARRTSSLSNDDVFRRFLETSLRLPNINNNHQNPLPKVDFRSLGSDDALRHVISDSFATVGCFQLLNHGIPLDVIASPAEASIAIFQVPPEKRGGVTRSVESPWGFEEDDEFVWGRDKEFNLRMQQLSAARYSNFNKKMENLVARIEKVAEKILQVIFEDSPRKVANSMEMIGGIERGTVCSVYKHCSDKTSGECGNSLNYDVIRMVMRGNRYSHCLCLHLCGGSSEFQVYSKKGWLSFFPEKGALVITAGDQTQMFSDGQYKHVIGRPIFKGEKEDCISMAFLCSAPNNKSNFEDSGERTISLGLQVLLAMILTLVCHVLICL